MVKYEQRVANMIANISLIEDSIQLEFVLEVRDWDRIKELIDLKEACYTELGRAVWIHKG